MIVNERSPVIVSYPSIPNPIIDISSANAVSIKNFLQGERVGSLVSPLSRSLLG